MSKQGLLIVISGPSGAGKGTICQGLLQQNTALYLSVSCTTRAPRPGERHGINYHFVDKEEFQHMIDNDQLLEYARVYDNFYGTPRQYVTEKLEKGQDVILEIDIQGAMQIKEKYPRGILIFVAPPCLSVLKDRLINRGTDAQESIENRLKCVCDEISNTGNYDYLVINDTVENALDQVDAIIKAEKCRPLYFDLEQFLTC